MPRLTGISINGTLHPITANGDAVPLDGDAILTINDLNVTAGNAGVDRANLLLKYLLGGTAITSVTWYQDGVNTGINMVQGDVIPTSLSGSLHVQTDGPGYVSNAVNVAEAILQPDFTVTNQADFDALVPANIVGKRIMFTDGADVVWPRNKFAVGFDLGGAVFYGEGIARDKTARTQRQIRTAEPDGIKNFNLENLLLSPTTKTTCLTFFGTEDVKVKDNWFWMSEAAATDDYSGGATSFPGGQGIFSNGAAPKRLRIHGNKITGCEYGVRLAVGDWIEVVGNEVDVFYADAMQINIGSTAAAVLNAFNIFTRGMTKLSDAGSPHGDGLQATGGNENSTSMVEGCGYDRGNGRGSVQPFFTSNPSGLGDNFTMRAMAVRDATLFDYTISAAQNGRMDRVAQLPHLIDTYPSNSGGIRLNGSGAGSTLQLRNTVSPLITTDPGTRVDTNVVASGSIPSRAAALARYPQAASLDAVEKLSLSQIMVAATPAGDAVGKSPQEVVTVGSSLVDSRLSEAFAPTPVLAVGAITPTTQGLSATVTSTVDGNPVFYAIAPAGTPTPTARQIKTRKVAGALAYGWKAVKIGTTTAAISQAGLFHNTGYILFVMQENGWSRTSAVSAVAFSTTEIIAPATAFAFISNTPTVTPVSGSINLSFGTVPAGRYIVPVACRAGINTAIVPSGMVVNGITWPLIAGSVITSGRSATAFYEVLLDAPYSGTWTIPASNIAYVVGGLYGAGAGAVQSLNGGDRNVTLTLAAGDDVIALGVLKGKTVVWENGDTEDFTHTPTTAIAVGATSFENAPAGSRVVGFTDVSSNFSERTMMAMTLR